jgi:hypothetical protein
MARTIEGTGQYREAMAALDQHGRFAHIDLSFFRSCQLAPERYYHGWCSGPDMFEVEIGNYVAYSYVLWEHDGVMQELQGRFLPYYLDSLRGQRLAEVTKFCRNNIEHIKPYVRRQQHFQAHRRLLNAMGEYLQALFISRRVYPISYDKWIRFQLETIISEPGIYRQLVELMELKQLESNELSMKAEQLASMLDTALRQ